MAGLSAGIYARANGFEATIIEMNHQPGGQCTAWDRDGYRFDYCLHWLVGTRNGPFHDIWKETDVLTPEVQVINHDTYARIVDESHGEFYIYNDLDVWGNYLVEFAPGDKKAIHEMCRMMRKTTQVAQFSDPPGMRSVKDYVNSFVHMSSVAGVLFKYSKNSCNQLFEDLGLQDEKLLFFLRKLYGEHDFSALGFLMMMGWFNDKNAGYLIGGSQAMTQRMAHKFQALGGHLVLGKRVREIIVEHNAATGVILDSGERRDADYVIGACDGHSLLYNMLHGNYLGNDIREAYDNWPLFTPLVMVSVGVDDVVKTESHMCQYFQEGLNIGSTPVNGYTIMNRSSYDPTFAPKGKSSVLLMFESPWESWANLQGEAYLDEKEAIRQDALELLEKQIPGIRKKIEVVDIATPRTTVRFTGVWKGSYEGFMPTGDITKTLPMQLPGLDRFIMAGQWLAPGGGLPPSAQSGKWAVQLICRAEKQPFQVAAAAELVH